MTYDDLIERAKTGPVTVAQIDAFCAHASQSIGESLNACALKLARDYSARAVDFDTADVLANALFAFAASSGASIPDLMFSIFLAFDAGEFYPDEIRDASPEDRFTRPEIERILAAHRAL